VQPEGLDQAPTVSGLSLTDWAGTVSHGPKQSQHSTVTPVCSWFLPPRVSRTSVDRLDLETVYVVSNCRTGGYRVCLVGKKWLKSYYSTFRCHLTKFV
jgi:hypothetical protein